MDLIKKTKFKTSVQLRYTLIHTLVLFKFTLSFFPKSV